MGAAAGSTTAAAVGTAVVASTVASIGMSAYGAMSSAKAQKDAANYNATMQGYQAKNALQVGADTAAAQKDKQRRIAGTQTAAMAAGGLDTSSGTPMQLLTETAGMGELDALRITNNASRTAWGYQAQGALDVYQGKTAQTQGYLGAASSILGGASKAYFGAYKAGAFD